MKISEFVALPYVATNIERIINKLKTDYTEWECGVGQVKRLLFGHKQTCFSDVNYAQFFSALDEVPTIYNKQDEDEYSTVEKFLMDMGIIGYFELTAEQFLRELERVIKNPESFSKKIKDTKIYSHKYYDSYEGFNRRARHELLIEYTVTKENIVKWEAFCTAIVYAAYHRYLSQPNIHWSYGTETNRASTEFDFYVHDFKDELEESIENWFIKELS